MTSARRFDTNVIPVGINVGLVRSAFRGDCFVAETRFLPPKNTFNLFLTDDAGEELDVLFDFGFRSGRSTGGIS